MTFHHQISFQISLHWHATMTDGESTIFLEGVEEREKLVIKLPYLLRQFNTWDYKTN